MGLTWSIVVLSALVLLVAGLRAAQSIRADRRRGRGTHPGQGYTVIEADYHSGGGGGGHSMQVRVPRDPQAYARLFVPKDTKQ